MDTEQGKMLTYCKSTTKKMKLSMKDFFNKCDEMCRKQRIWAHLLKKSWMENLIFCAAEASTLKATFIHLFI